MSISQRLLIPLVLAASTGAGAIAQSASEPTQPDPAAAEAPAEIDAAAAVDWSFYASAFYYIVPDDDDYVQPTFMADYDWLHLEVRYNYEALDTGSAWVGYNLGGGEELEWAFTPMIGGVFGDTNGAAVGFLGSLNWWKLELYIESEYVFDADDSSQNFLYNWAELTLAPVEWFRFGLVTQRTKVRDSDRDLQLGVLVGLSFGGLDLGAYVLNLEEDKPTVAFSVGLSF